MRPRDLVLSLTLLLAGSPCPAAHPDGNRLTYLDGGDPYHVGLDFPRLVTPQWVGEDGVEAVVVLAIDDMRQSSPYEAFLRPILDRLKAIDGRAPLSIMTCRADPNDPRLRSWLAEGLNLDVHTLDHPCPLLKDGKIDVARKTVLGCIDLLNQVPGNRPVAFRMPCCDSRNTLSPRFFAEIFNRPSPAGHWLSIDSSVFLLLTPNDPDLPRPLVVEPDGRARFRKYVPFPSFVNTIEDYPYPYVIGRTCWEFPCIVPSDWEAQALQKPNNPKTVADMKAALDAVVLKKGVFNLVFHPHGWIRNDQVVELIDHAVKTHGKKVKFLNFREAQERLDRNLLGGQPLRASDGRENGVRLLDLDGDGYLDVVIGNEHKKETRLWSPSSRSWTVGSFPTAIVLADPTGPRGDAGVRFGTVTETGRPVTMMLVRNESAAGDWAFRGSSWVEGRRGVPGRPGLSDLQIGGRPLSTSREGRDRGVRFLDIDGDGNCELVVGNPEENAVFFLGESGSWSPSGWDLPAGARVVDAQGRDAGLRFLDIDEDGRRDVLFANERGRGIGLFDTRDRGWARRVPPETLKGLPEIARSGEDRGAWFHSRGVWWQNEDTATLPDLVDRRSFNDLLKGVEPRAKDPEASRRSFRVADGFRVELAAREPLVKDPIAFDWGADGRLWVVEMGDYPLGADGKGKPGGVVRVLDDVDGDGRYDRSTVFLDGLAFPTAVLPWRRGVLVGCAPDIFYAEDRDGDGKADVREVLFTGFGEGNQQHRLNGFDFGLDGWVYGANGDSGGTIRSLKTGATVEINNRDFRFRPDDGRLEAESGQTQYGRHRDDWGHWFGNNNPSWAWHYVLSESDLRRNPQLAPPDPRHLLEPDSRLFPVSRTFARFNDPGAANRTTSANSPTPYRDDLFGPAFEGSLFVSEPVHNLVHRVILEPDGVTFRGRRGLDEADREFLASSDNWTRPTMLKTGPDGALWVADMYRAVIEHPEWIPDDWEKRLDLRAGSEEGRIYRVLPVDRPARPIDRLDRLDTAGLVAALDSPSGWRRDTAQRLLIHRGDRSAAGPLARLAAGAASPKTRVQALWTLRTLDALSDDSALEALGDPHPQVRRNAIKAGEDRLDACPKLGEALLRLVDDPDAEVRLQVALSLGRWADPRAGRALAALLRRAPEDPWVRAAVLSSAPPHAGSILAALFSDAKDGPPPAEVVGPLFALAGSSKDRAALGALLRDVGTPKGTGGRFAPWQFSALAGLLDASERAGKPLGSEGRGPLEQIEEAARVVAADSKAGEEERLAAIRLLGRDDPRRKADREALAGLLRPQVPVALQQAAVAAIARRADPEVPAILLAGWKGHSPRLRDAILDALLGRDAWAGALLFALEDLCIPEAEIGPAQRRRLLDSRDPALKRRAETVFARPATSKEALLATYRAALATPGDPAAGAAAFKKTCASCHKLGTEGVEVGPDLAALTDRSPESLLVAILDPNRAFEAKYTNFTVQTVDGRVLTGLIAAETGNAVTLRRQEGKQDVLLRSEIEAMAASGQSLMPEGLEKDLTPKALADLVSFLAGAGPPPRKLEGNHPRPVPPGADGTIVLRAEDAEVYGGSLTFETRYGNLGYWSRPDDHAAWRFGVARPGRYTVSIEWACDDGMAGNTLVLRTGSQSLVRKVAGTGSWDTYRSAEIGQVTLEAGHGRLEALPAGPIAGALMDLRAVILRPAP